MIKMKCLDCGSEKKSNKGLYCKKCGYKHMTRPNNLKYNIKNENKSWFKKGHKVRLNKKHKEITKLQISKTLKKKYQNGLVCWMKNRFDELASNWRGGTTNLCEGIRKSNKYKQWRKKVYKIYNYKCNICGINKNLEAHHINEFIKIIKENKISNFKEANRCNSLWDINNGMLLCNKCHNKTKKGCGKK